MLPLIIRFLKFIIVGATCVVIDFSITYFAKEKLRLNKYVSNSLGFVVAVCVNFYLNRLWTFHNHNPEIYTQFIKFLGVATIGLILNNLITYFFTEKKEINFYFSKGLATIIVFFWNFTMNSFFTFNS
jgi:putative flippase GtrA